MAVVSWWIQCRYIRVTGMQWQIRVRQCSCRSCGIGHTAQWLQEPSVVGWVAGWTLLADADHTNWPTDRLAAVAIAVTSGHRARWKLSMSGQLTAVDLESMQWWMLGRVWPVKHSSNDAVFIIFIVAIILWSLECPFKIIDQSTGPIFSNSTLINMQRLHHAWLWQSACCTCSRAACMWLYRFWQGRAPTGPGRAWCNNHCRYDLDLMALRRWRGGWLEAGITIDLWSSSSGHIPVHVHNDATSVLYGSLWYTMSFFNPLVLIC